jgi:hypothetical protein
MSLVPRDRFVERNHVLKATYIMDYINIHVHEQYTPYGVLSACNGGLGLAIPWGLGSHLTGVGGAET